MIRRQAAAMRAVIVASVFLSLLAPARAQMPTEDPRQHAGRHLALMEEAYAARSGAQSGEWRRRIETLRSELEKAYAWLLSNGRAEDVLTFARALSVYWERGNVAQARTVVDQALALPAAGPTAMRAELLERAAILAFRQDDVVTARSRIEESLTVARTLNDRRLTASALTGRAQVALRENPTTVATYGNEAVALYRELGDRNGEGHASHMMAEAARMMNDSAAEGMYQQSIKLYRELGDDGMVATEFHNLAYVKLQQNQPRRAEEHFRESWTIFRARNNDSLDPYLIAGMAAVAALDNDGERAARLFGAAAAMFDAVKSAPDPADKIEMDKYAARARAQLGEQAYAVAYAAGRSLTKDAAMQLAMGQR